MRLSANEMRLARLSGRLSLAFRKLSALPVEVWDLTDLETLNLSGNLLTVLPSEIGRLASLKSLSLSGNRIIALPPEIGRLVNLQTLNLSDNLLTGLPPGIKGLGKLRSLNVTYNRLTGLPRELAALLDAGLMIELEGNPLAEPFPELIERGFDALASYLQSLYDAVELYEAKILLVGEGNVGKTSLIAALTSAPFIEGRSTTHGIEIHSLPFGHPDLNEVMTMRAWDFGGQEVYRITHQFFFSRRAVYLVAGYAADTAASMRRMMRAVGSEIGDCPLLFTITEQARQGARRLRVDQRDYRIVLWCEDPGHWHPWTEASYSVSQPREWLLRIGPYATLILKALKLAMPLAVPAADLLLTDTQMASIQHELDLMTAVIAELPEQTRADQDMPGVGPSSPLTRAEGAAARSLRQLLFEHDPARAFGDLRRVQSPSGDLLWVCTDHYAEYDPGLPQIPSSSRSDSTK